MDKLKRKMAEALVNVATNGAMDRVDQRSRRARELRQWGLHPHHAERGSSLAADDAAFEAAFPLALSGGVGVTEEVLFPMMSATESLYAVGLLIERRGASGDVYAMPVMQLCRSAMESSARAIWILSPPSREVRRDRALSALIEQLEQQKRFLKIEAENQTNGLTKPNPPQVAQMNRTHRQKQADLVQRLKDTYPVPKLDSFTTTIRISAQWVDSHLPAHDTGELSANKLEGGARAFYSWGSSFVHGYKWAADYVPGVKLFPMIADSLGAAVFMTECAVSLYEAACRAPGVAQTNAQSYVPNRLKPTIETWTKEMFRQSV